MIDYCYHCGAWKPCCEDCGNCPRGCTCRNDPEEDTDPIPEETTP